MGSRERLVLQHNNALKKADFILAFWANNVTPHKGQRPSRSLCVCTCVCDMCDWVCVCMCVCVCVSVVCVFGWVRVCVSACVRLSAYLWYVWLGECVWVCVHVFLSVCLSLTQHSLFSSKHGKKTVPPDTVLLHVGIKRGQKASNFVPHCFKLETYLRMAEIPYQVQVTRIFLNREEC